MYIYIYIHTYIYIYIQVGLHPYDIFQRPMAPVAEGARVMAQALRALSDAPDAPLIIWEHPFALHLPWLTFGQAMWGTINGINAPRGLRVYEAYSRAMRDAGVLALDAFRLSDGRSDETHDGLHYYHRRSRDGQVHTP